MEKQSTIVLLITKAKNTLITTRLVEFLWNKDIDRNQVCIKRHTIALIVKDNQASMTDIDKNYNMFKNRHLGIHNYLIPNLIHDREIITQHKLTTTTWPHDLT